MSTFKNDNSTLEYQLQVCPHCRQVIGKKIKPLPLTDLYSEPCKYYVPKQREKTSKGD